MTNDNKIRFTLRINTAINKFISEEANRKGVPKNAIITEILWNYFKQ